MQPFRRRLPLTSRSATREARHRILLVDDDAVSLDLMALILAYEGHQVQRANNAGAALKLLASENGQRPDVLLVDLQMPGVSGRQLAEQVRALQGSEPLVLAMSATGVQKQQLLAFDGFLLKPLAPGDLGRALHPRKRGRKPIARAVHPRKPASLTENGLDMAVVRKLLGMMPEQSLHDLVFACIADSRACIDGMRDQVRNGNDARLSELAHRVKGAASMVGSTRLSKLAADLEKGQRKEAAPGDVFEDLLHACSELEQMLLAGKFKKN
jgi:CheY-like chemotaxis protein/HPt (histidine-containing phosphotransfer) domain-containing protein